MIDLIYKLIKFGITGFIGLIIDFAVTFFCKEKLKWNKYVSNSLGFSLAVCNNYFLNRVWTFKSSDPNIVKQFSYFLFISIIGLLLNNLVLYVMNEKKNKQFYFSKIVATILVFFWNFGANFLLTFQ
jgi:putative flippase GtrA